METRTPTLIQAQALFGFEAKIQGAPARVWCHDKSNVN